MKTICRRRMAILRNARQMAISPSRSLAYCRRPTEGVAISNISASWFIVAPTAATGLPLSFRFHSDAFLFPLDAAGAALHHDVIRLPDAHFYEKSARCRAWFRVKYRPMGRSWPEEPAAQNPSHDQSDQEEFYKSDDRVLRYRNGYLPMVSCFSGGEKC